MKLLFYRATHDKDGNYIGNSKAKKLEIYKVWQCQDHSGGLVGHLLSGQVGMTFVTLRKASTKYSREWHEPLESNESLLTALFELVRVGVVRYEIVVDTKYN